MKKALGMLFVFAIAASPALAQKVTIDYAHDFDFSKVKTFEYVDTPESNAKDSLMARRIASAIVMELKEGGLEQVESGGDILVTYHVTTEQNTVYNTTNFGYGGFHGGWGGWGYGGLGMGSATTTATNYTEGTLIIDGYEPGDKKMVWRGTGTVTVKDDPQKVSKQIDKILHKLGKKWDKILKNKGK